MSDNLALYRKYRSLDFDSVLGQEHITKPLADAVKAVPGDAVLIMYHTLHSSTRVAGPDPRCMVYFRIRYLLSSPDSCFCGSDSQRHQPPPDTPHSSLACSLTYCLDGCVVHPDQLVTNGSTRQR